jgi:hypothetical protein
MARNQPKQEIVKEKTDHLISPLKDKDIFSQALHSVKLWKYLMQEYQLPYVEITEPTLESDIEKPLPTSCPSSPPARATGTISDLPVAADSRPLPPLPAAADGVARQSLGAGGRGALFPRSWRRRRGPGGHGGRRAQREARRRGICCAKISLRWVGGGCSHRRWLHGGGGPSVDRRW